MPSDPAVSAERRDELQIMNVLMLHNSYKIRGGEDESFESEVRMLHDAGHFVETIHVNNEDVEAIGKFTVAVESIWSRPSFDLVDRKLAERPYDVLHVQNFFPRLSPSVYSAARKHRVAVVQTLRNYRLLCPSAILFRDGHICEECVGKLLKFPGIRHACYRNSRIGTATIAAMTALHTLKGTWRDDVDLYLTLTEFSRQKFVAAGFAADRILVKNNFVYPDPGPAAGGGGYVLYVGRLNPEKGIETLLSAWDTLDTSWKLKIVGEGPLAARVAQYCESKVNAEWLGVKGGAEVKELMGAAEALVFPSEWYETFGRVAIESFAKGTPVVASRLGAMAEIIREKETGLLFEPGNASDLAGKLRWAFTHSDELLKMRAGARADYEAKYTAKENCRLLVSAYEAARQIREQANLAA